MRTRVISLGENEGHRQVSAGLVTLPSNNVKTKGWGTDSSKGKTETWNHFFLETDILLNPYISIIIIIIITP